MAGIGEKLTRIFEKDTVTTNLIGMGDKVGDNI